MASRSIFALPDRIGPGKEVSETLVSAGQVLIERIVSAGYASPPGTWFDQDRDEWVLLVQGEAIVSYEQGGEERLATGEWTLIPAHRRHRVAFTTADPPCIWICCHAPLR